MELWPKITEELLYYVWKSRSFDQEGLQTTNGEDIKIIQPGMQNYDSGPDFSNARIQIGETLWAGHVEMHVYSSDWNRHGHQSDKAYRNVILHVVFDHDKEIARHTGENIPTLELKNRIPIHLMRNYFQLVEANLDIPCEKVIHHADLSKFSIWKYRLVVQRLERKTSFVKEILETSAGDWEEVLYRSLCKYFGGKVNTPGFEALAARLPYLLLHKNRHHPKAVEALLFGVAGFLEADHKDDYFLELKTEFSFLRKKYSLEPIPAVTWKFSRMLPAGFPTIRLAQLAAILLKNEKLFSEIKNAASLKDMFAIFDVQIHEYWDTHYHFGKSAEKKKKNPGKDFQDVLLINAVVPVVFNYGKHTGEEQYTEKAIDILEKLKSENNHIVKKWKELGFSAQNAFDSQALIELRKEYCYHKKCLQCAIGNSLIGKE
jgi:hypothetical protein